MLATVATSLATSAHTKVAFNKSICNAIIVSVISFGSFVAVYYSYSLHYGVKGCGLLTVLLYILVFIVVYFSPFFTPCLNNVLIGITILCLLSKLLETGIREHNKGANDDDSSNNSSGSNGRVEQKPVDNSHQKDGQ